MPKLPLVIVSCLVFDAQNRLLLLRRHSEDLGGGMWAAPGGKQEPGEEPRVAVIRETQEETGLAIGEADYLGAHELRMPHGTVHMKTFAAQVGGNEEVIINKDEHETHAWFDTSSLLNTENIIWGLPSTLRDFALVDPFDHDPTLADGSQAILLELANRRQ